MEHFLRQSMAESLYSKDRKPSNRPARKVNKTGVVEEFLNKLALGYIENKEEEGINRIIVYSKRSQHMHNQH